jgi:type II secretory pathway component PulM
MMAVASTLRMPASFSRWWSGKPARERRVLAIAGALAAVAIAWLVVWRPLTQDVAALRVEVPREAAALADARRIADEIAGLARVAPVARPGDARAELDRVLTQQGVRAAVTQLEWQESRARLTFAALRFDTLVATLEAVQRETGLALVEGTITARVDPGTVRAELVLTR